LVYFFEISVSYSGVYSFPTSFFLLVRSQIHYPPKSIFIINVLIIGDVKIFDFGLAKELDPSLRHGCTEFYELSGNTGSLRYMSPEVARCEPYNLTADVYSFGLLLWQVCSLQLPYDGMNRQDHSELVVHGNERPPLDSAWSTPLRILMKRAWEQDPLARPSMDSIYKILRREICALRDGDDTGLEHFSRRSTFVLNRDSAANSGMNTTSSELDMAAASTRGLPRGANSRRNVQGSGGANAQRNSLNDSQHVARGTNPVVG
jgi:serine/threonine protein kinase